VILLALDPIFLTQIYELALNTAKEAGGLIKAKRNNGNLTNQYKGAHELVTDADIAADQLIINRIRAVFPQHRFLTEETYNDTSESHDLSTPIWIIDPIDGTVNYAHGHQMVAVSIAFACENEVQIGLVYNPFMDETFSAIRGQGAHLNGCKIKASQETNLREALVATGFPYDKSGVAPIIQRVAKILMHCQDLRRLGSAALDICWVACGRLDVYFESLSPWDFAAARLVAHEAGAQCGHFGHKPTDIPACIYPNDLLIASPALFEKTRELLREASGY
jgi:myo-inositol-1(or 4)-monophosphatase